MHTKVVQWGNAVTDYIIIKWKAGWFVGNRSLTGCLWINASIYEYMCTTITTTKGRTATPLNCIDDIG